MRSCPRCGAEIPSDVRFCNVCGASLAAKSWVLPLAVVGGCLLLVVLVGGILVAIMFPVFQRGRGDAQRANCMSNLRQVAAACLTYAVANQEGLPASLDQVRSQLRSAVLLRCPTSGEPYQYFPLGNLKDIPHPADAAMIRCPTHNNVAYADGHVERVSGATGASPPGVAVPAQRTARPPYGRAGPGASPPGVAVPAQGPARVPQPVYPQPAPPAARPATAPPAPPRAGARPAPAPPRKGAAAR